MKANTLNIKNDLVWRPTHQELKVIEYEGQHFMNLKLLSMKATISRMKNFWVWKTTLKIIEYEGQHSRIKNYWAWKPTFHELKINEYEGQNFIN